MTKRDIYDYWQKYQKGEIESNFFVTTWISSKLNHNRKGHVLPTLIQFLVHRTSIVTSTSRTWLFQKTVLLYQPTVPDWLEITVPLCGWSTTRGGGNTAATTSRGRTRQCLRVCLYVYHTLEVTLPDGLGIFGPRVYRWHWDLERRDFFFQPGFPPNWITTGRDMSCPLWFNFMSVGQVL